MLSVCSFSRNSYAVTCLITQVRNKVHWAKAKRKTSAKYKAMNHFDDFYGSIFGDQWPPMKEALLRKSKYVAVVNNYGNPDETMEFLTNRGAHCLKNLLTVQNKFHNEYSPEKKIEVKENQNVSDQKIEEYAEKLQSDIIEKLYPQGKPAPDRLDFTDDGEKAEVKKIKDSIVPTHKTLDESLSEAVFDETRIIDPAMGLTSEALYQYIPATKLKGMDDWIPESVHYSSMAKDKDFPLLIEPETTLQYPEHLKVFTYEMGSEWGSFPEPKRCDTGKKYEENIKLVMRQPSSEQYKSKPHVYLFTHWARSLDRNVFGVYNYYPMDGGSVVTVLALDVQGGDRVLDLCSAPGGKALVALQTLLPDIVVCNDISISRGNRTRRVFRDYLFDFETSNKWRERVILKNIDGRKFTDDEGFDKVLVDVPCTTDRHSVNEDDNNMFRPDRIRERLRIQELQAQLLINALRLAKVGGTVVYSTCSLSPIQNDGVVHSALKQAFENYNLIATVKDLTAAMAGFSSTLQLGSGSSAPKYGQLILPSIEANFGPTYFAKLVRVK